MIRLSLGLTALLILASAAAACPFCDGGPGGNDVRSAIFGDDFWPTVGGVLLPFPLVLGVAALLHFVGRDGQ